MASAAAMVALVAAACTVTPPAPRPDPTATAVAAELGRLRATATALAQATATPQPTTAPTMTAQPTATPSPVGDVVALVKRYTVLVVTDQGPAGSGISLGDGNVLTAHHVVEAASEVAVRFASGRRELVRVAGVDPRRDLALLRSSFTDEPGAALGDLAALRSGDGLIAVGYPLSGLIGAQDATVTRGTFSGRWQSPRGVWHVQTDTALSPGSSGGPLADSQGRLVGVVTFGISPAVAVGLNFAVADDEVKAFLQAPQPSSAPAFGPGPPADASPGRAKPTSPQMASPYPPPTAPPRTPVITAPPDPEAVAQDPVETVRRQYQFIDARRYEEGYALLSARLRARSSLADYQGWFANKMSLRVLQVALIALDGGRATVEATVVSTDRVRGREVREEVTERTALVLEGGAWRIDEVARER